MKRLRLAIYLTILFLFLVPQFYFLDKRTQSFNFGDENEHLVPAFMMSKNNDKLYEDLSTNHQPLPIITATLFHELVPYTNSLLYIERVRQFMFIISAAGALVLTLRFGAVGLVSSILLESVKFYFFGYHLLAESLVVYPLMYLGAILFEAGQKPTRPSSNSLTRIDSLIIGACIFWIAFNLLPTWPFLAIFTLYYLLTKKIDKPSRLLILLSFTIPTIALFVFIKSALWFDETIANNYKYFLPFDSQLSPRNPSDMISLAMYPLQSFLHLNQPVARFYAIFVLLAALSIIIFKFSKITRISKYRFISFYLLIILLNLRTASSDVAFYTAFHLLPQVALLTIFVTSLVFFAIQNLPKTKQYTLVASIMLLFTMLLINNTIWWRESVNTNKFDDHYIQYGDEESVAMAITSIKNENDTLLAGPQSGLINIFSNTDLGTKKTAYLDWSFSSPTLKEDFHNTMENSPPTFVYFPTTSNAYSVALQPYLNSKYTRIQRSFGSETNLYVLSTSIDNHSQEQWKHFSDLLYKPPR